METNQENEKMENFDQKVAQVFQEKLPEPPALPEIEELDQEVLDRLQAAGDSMLSAYIIRFLKKNK